MNPKASWSWQTDDITMAVSYTHSVRAGDGYEFRMTSSPTLHMALLVEAIACASPPADAG